MRVSENMIETFRGSSSLVQERLASLYDIEVRLKKLYPGSVEAVKAHDAADGEKGKWEGSENLRVDCLEYQICRSVNIDVAWRAVNKLIYAHVSYLLSLAKDTMERSEKELAEGADEFHLDKVSEG
jgi:hypothetical protein